MPDLAIIASDPRLTDGVVRLRPWRPADADVGVRGLPGSTHRQVRPDPTAVHDGGRDRLRRLRGGRHRGRPECPSGDRRCRRLTPCWVRSRATAVTDTGPRSATGSRRRRAVEASPPGRSGSSWTGRSPRPTSSAWSCTRTPTTMRPGPSRFARDFEREGVRRAWDLDRDGRPIDSVFYVRVRPPR